MKREICVVTGAAGFIGSHLADRLLALGHKVIGIDNLLLGKRAHLVQAFHSPDFSFIEEDVNDYSSCLKHLRTAAGPNPIDLVWHMAANSDIRAGTADPEVDLRSTFMTTFNVLKLMKRLDIRKLAFASSSAIYGNHPATLTEDSGPLQPISNYGAMKLASEGCISAALETFLERAWIFRFPNVVGSHSTHGVIYDFIKKLQTNSKELEVLGDGFQDKPYFHVSDLVDAMVFIVANAAVRLNCFNIGTDGTSTTVKYIAEAVVGEISPKATIRYTGGAKGWPGDVPKFTYSINKLRQLGWLPKLRSTEAVDRAIKEIAKELAG
ncbi:MAG: NAD-dependent epimerase/dehydratase family protein [Verrucomicrobiota bacterium]